MELTLRSGEKINNSLSVATIEAAIRSIDSAVVSRGNKKDKLALLKNMVVEELEYSGIQGGCSDTEQHTFCAHCRHFLVLAQGVKKQLR